MGGGGQRSRPPFPPHCRPAPHPTRASTWRPDSSTAHSRQAGQSSSWAEKVTSQRRDLQRLRSGVRAQKLPSKPHSRESRLPQLEAPSSARPHFVTRRPRLSSRSETFSQRARRSQTSDYGLCSSPSLNSASRQMSAQAQPRDFPARSSAHAQV